MGTECEAPLHRAVVGSEPVSNAVVTAVSEALSVSATDLEPLAHAIDTDALDALAESMGPSGRICFEYEGVEVLVTGDGIVSVRKCDAA